MTSPIPENNEHLRALYDPAHAIIGFADLLKHTPLDDKQAEYAEAILTAGKSILSILNRQYGSPDETAQEPAISETAESGKAGPLRVLACEENTLGRRLLRNILEGFGYEAVIAATGLQCIETARKETFDAMVICLQMPDMNGFDMAVYLRTQLKLTTPIIALSAHAQPGERDRCLAAGMNGYLVKPVRQQELLQKIREVAHTEAGSVIDRETIPLNLDYLKELSGGNRVFERDMLKLFISEVSENVRDLEKYYEQGDTKKMAFVVHKLKSSVQLVGYEALIPLLSDLETVSIRSGITENDTKCYRFLISQLRRGFRDIGQLLETEYKAV